MTTQPPNSRPRGGHEPPRPAPTIAGLRKAAPHCTACASCGRPCRSPVCRTGGKAARPLPRRGRHRSCVDLHHQRCQTFQMGASRIAARSQQAGSGGDRGPAFRGSRPKFGDSAANHRCAGSDGGTGLVWKSVPRHLGSRSTDAVGVGDRYARDSAPLGTFVRSRRGMGRTRNPQIRRDFRKVAAMVT